MHVEMDMRLKFDNLANSEDYRFDFDVAANGQITGEVRTLDGAKVSDLTGARKPGVHPIQAATVINFIFELRGDRIFLGGRVRGIFYDGRFRAFTLRTAPGVVPALFEPGDTGTGGGHQTTLLLATESLDLT